MYSEQDLKYAAQFREEIHNEALARVRAVCPSADHVVDPYPADAYFQEVWDYPGKWYTVVGTPPGAGGRKDLVNAIVRETLGYYRNTGAAFTDDTFYRLLARYPDIVCDYCLINAENRSAETNGVFPYRGADSHRRALDRAARELFEDGREWAYDLEGARCRKLSGKALFAPAGSDAWLNYRKAFLCPPHAHSYTDDDFERVNAVLFPGGADKLEVYRWTTDWSEYFNEGNEWWGALCLTVYDKTLDRFVIIMVSATDETDIRREPMQSLSLSQLKDASFIVRPAPVLRPFGGSFVVADPSLLLPGETPDGKWHMFFHTMFGVWEAVSDDGVTFAKAKKLLPRAMRPNINFIDGRYVLFYERTRPLVFNALNLVGAARWESGIFAAESRDLESWSAPKPVLCHTMPYEESKQGVSLSNPFFLRDGDVDRLYYSCGLTFIKDCGFCEPTYVSYAESEAPLSGYRAASAPILKPDPDDPFLNLCSGCLKVYRLSDCFIGIQNGIFEKDGKSASAILLLSSQDGRSFRYEKTLVEPRGDGGWMSQFVYASHLVRTGDVLRLYFNARNVADPLRGRECIGFAEAKIKE